MSSHIRGPVVTVYVGCSGELETYTIHKTLLHEKSKYFRTAFNGNFAESVSSELSLPDDNPIGFRGFVDWLYTGNVPEKLDSYATAALWILADKFMCIALKNKIIDRVVSLNKKRPLDVESCELLVQSGHRDSKLMDYVLTRTAYSCSKNWGENEEFVRDFVDLQDTEATVRLIGKIHENDTRRYHIDPAFDDSSKWHEREDESKGNCNEPPSKKRKIG